MKDDLERELDGDTSNKKKFRTGTPGKASSDIVFSNNTKTRKPGDIGKAAAQFDKPKLLVTEEQVLEERLRKKKKKKIRGEW